MRLEAVQEALVIEDRLFRIRENRLVDLADRNFPTEVLLCCIEANSNNAVEDVRK